MNTIPEPGTLCRIIDSDHSREWLRKSMLTNMELCGITFTAGQECGHRRHGPAVYIGSGEHTGIWVYCESIELVEARDLFLEHYL